MKKQPFEPTLDRFSQQIIDELKSLDIAQMIAYYSIPAIDQKERDHKIRGYLSLHEALQNIRFAKSLIQ